jgi:multisubunit Na+/H+ antiporter MnhF subunit
MTDRERRQNRLVLGVLAVLLVFGLVTGSHFFIATAVVIIIIAFGASLLIQRRTPPDLGE